MSHRAAPVVEPQQGEKHPCSYKAFAAAPTRLLRSNSVAPALSLQKSANAWPVMAARIAEPGKAPRYPRDPPWEFRLATNQPGHSDLGTPLPSDGDGTLGLTQQRHRAAVVVPLSQARVTLPCLIGLHFPAWVSRTLP